MVVNIVVDPDALNVVKKATLAENVHKTVAAVAEVVVVAMAVAKEVVPVLNVVKKDTSPENVLRPVAAVVEVAMVAAEVTVEVAEAVTVVAVAVVAEEEETPELICQHKIKLPKKVLSKPIQAPENL